MNSEIAAALAERYPETASLDHLPLPIDIHERLNHAAASNRRSVAAEVAAILDKALAQLPSTKPPGGALSGKRLDADSAPFAALISGIVDALGDFRVQAEADAVTAMIDAVDELENRFGDMVRTFRDRCDG